MRRDPKVLPDPTRLGWGGVRVVGTRNRWCGGRGGVSGARSSVWFSVSGWAWNQRGGKRREGADESFDGSDFDQPPGRRQPSRRDLSAVRSGHGALQLRHAGHEEPQRSWWGKTEEEVGLWREWSSEGT